MCGFIVYFCKKKCRWCIHIYIQGCHSYATNKHDRITACKQLWAWVLQPFICQAVHFSVTISFHLGCILPDGENVKQLSVLTPVQDLIAPYQKMEYQVMESFLFFPPRQQFGHWASKVNNVWKLSSKLRWLSDTTWQFPSSSHRMSWLRSGGGQRGAVI